MRRCLEGELCSSKLAGLYAHMLHTTMETTGSAEAKSMLYLVRLAHRRQVPWMLWVHADVAAALNDMLPPGASAGRARLRPRGRRRSVDVIFFYGHVELQDTVKLAHRTFSCSPDGLLHTPCAHAIAQCLVAKARASMYNSPMLGLALPP